MPFDYSRIFQSEALRKIDRAVSQMATADITVLLTGENETGKEFISEDALSKTPPAEGSGPTNAILARIPVGRVPSRGV